jgi:hypothetical protein
MQATESSDLKLHAAHLATLTQLDGVLAQMIAAGTTATTTAVTRARGRRDRLRRLATSGAAGANALAVLEATVLTATSSSPSPSSGGGGGGVLNLTSTDVIEKLLIGTIKKVNPTQQVDTEKIKLVAQVTAQVNRLADDAAEAVAAGGSGGGSADALLEEMESISYMQQVLIRQHTRQQLQAHGFLPW